MSFLDAGEGRDPAAWYLGKIFARLVGEDDAEDLDWDDAAGGFMWRPYGLAQRLAPAPGDPARLRVTTEVAAGVPATDEVLAAIARRNALFCDAALVLDEDGTLFLGCQASLLWDRDEAELTRLTDLAVRQYVAAAALGEQWRDLLADDAADEWLDWYIAELDDDVKYRADGREPQPHVALVATGAQYALPYRVTAGGGDLGFSWRPAHTGLGAPASPEVRVTVAPGAGPAAPEWVVRSRLPVTGDEAAKARWCNARNSELLFDPRPSDDPMVTGGWGLGADGDCCLSTAQPWLSVSDSDERAAARRLGHLLSEAQRVVVEALRAEPAVVAEVPLTATELAAGLGTVRAAFGVLFGDQADLPWAAEPGLEGVLVTCGDLMVEVPVGYGRAPLALIYGELLKSSPNGRSILWFRGHFPDREMESAMARLEQQGLVRYDGSGQWVFATGRSQARLETGWVRDDAEEGLRVAGVPDDPAYRRFELTLPPTRFAWDEENDAVEVLTWAVDHVIRQVRLSARLAAWLAGQPLSGTPSPGEPRRAYDSGRSAAVALRARLLRLLGAEPQWLLGEPDARNVIWSSGPATTVFEVTEPAASDAGLGVLRVYTPVAAEGNGRAARKVCGALNALTGTARWSVAREPDFDGSYYDEVQVSCAFVIDPSDQGMLDSIALWCVREQIAVASAHILSGEIAKAISGVNSRFTGFPAGDDRVTAHPVTSFLDRAVLLSTSVAADVLAATWQEAVRALLPRMLAEGTGVWCAPDGEIPPAYEIPFSWDSYRDGMISSLWSGDTAQVPLTAVLRMLPARHDKLGNGLRLTVRVPVGPYENDEVPINELNRLDTDEAMGASHSFGGWTVLESPDGQQAPEYVVFLPTAFAGAVTDLALVMQEIALTLARQALLARRVLLPVRQWTAEDTGSRIGLSVSANPRSPRARGPRGLAWGEPRAAR